MKSANKNFAYSAAYLSEITPGNTPSVEEAKPATEEKQPVVAAGTPEAAPAVKATPSKPNFNERIDAIVAADTTPQELKDLINRYRAIKFSQVVEEPAEGKRAFIGITRLYGQKAFTYTYREVTYNILDAFVGFVAVPAESAIEIPDEALNFKRGTRCGTNALMVQLIDALYEQRAEVLQFGPEQLAPEQEAHPEPVAAEAPKAEKTPKAPKAEKTAKGKTAPKKPAPKKGQKATGDAANR